MIDLRVMGPGCRLAVAVCAVFVACSDPVTDAITAAEKFVSAKDFEEADRLLAQTPFKTPDDKRRIADARERVDREKKVRHIDEVLAATEAMTDMPQGGPFFGLASLERFFTPPLMHRYNKLVMRYNLPVNACAVRKRAAPHLLCPLGLPYLAPHLLVDGMVARAEAFAEQGNLVAAVCTREFVLRTLQPVLEGRPDRMMVSNRLFAAMQTLQTGLRESDEQFRVTVLELQSVCSPDVVFGKGV